MANSILGNKSASASPSMGANPNILQQIQAFGASYKGDPKQAVMQMLQQGRINNLQLQQAIQTAKQIQNMLK